MRPPSYVTLRSSQLSKATACFIACAVFACSIGVLAGWAFGAKELTSLLPGLPPMKVNTAICLGLLAAALGIGARVDPLPRWLIALPSLAGAIVALSMAQSWFAIDIGIDQLLFVDTTSPANLPPGRMAQTTAVAIAFLAIALAARGTRVPRRYRQLCALLPFVFGILALIGHAYGVHYIPNAASPFATMAVPTALSIMALGLASLAAEPDDGIMRIILADRVGGRFARLLLPVAMLFPIIVGSLCLTGQNAGFYGANFGVLIMVVSAITVFSTISILTARWLNRSEDDLLEAQHTLERRVRERTIELEATVTQLRAEIVLRETAENANAESQELFRNALEFAPIGMALVGLDGHWLRVNRALCGIVGYSEQEMLKLTFQDITHPDDLDADLVQGRNLINGTISSYQMEKRYTRKNHEMVWVMLSASLVRDGENKPLYFVAQIEDISERRKVTQDLEGSQKLLAEVIAALPIPFSLKAEDTRWIMANDAMARYSGKSVEELIGKTDEDQFGPEVAAIYKAEDARALAASEPIVTEGINITASGEKRWVLKYKRGIDLPDGRRMIAVTVTDISQHRETEERLRKSEERFRSLTELSADWYWEQDENFRFTALSGAVLDAVGLDSNSYLGKARWDLVYDNMAAEDWARHRAQLNKHEPYRDLVLVRKLDDGITRYMAISGEPMYGEDGSFKGYRGVGRDVTARMRADKELADSRRFLADLIDAIPIPITVKDDSHRFLIVNAAMGRFLGRPAADLQGKFDADFFPQERVKVMLAEDDAVLETGVPFLTEQPYVTISEESRWVLKHKRRIVSFDGKRWVISALLDITQRKKVELEVERSQKFLESVIEAIPQPVFVKDSKHRWVLFNNAFCELLGHARADLLGRSDPDVFPEEWVKRVWAEDDQVLSGTGSLVSGEANERRADGSVRWLLKSKQRVTLSDESPYIVGISTDITRLKQVEEALRKSDDLHRLLAENSSDMISLLTPQGIVSYASPASMGLLGYPPEEIVGLALLQFAHPDDAPRMQQIFSGVEEHHSNVLTCRLRHAGGGWTWIETAFRAARRANADAPLQVIAVSRDVDDRIRDGEALNRFKYMLDSSLDTILLYDADTLRFNYVNDGAVKTLGYPKEKLLGMAPWELRGDISVTDYHKSIEPFLRGDIQSRKFESLYRHADGELIPMDVSMQLVRRAGEPGTFIAVARDATERRAVERLKNEFVSTVSHELRTPVTSIRGSLGLLAGGIAGELPQQAKQLVDIAYSNSERLIRLINDILDIEKIESGKMRFVMRPVTLRGLLETPLAENRGYAEQFGVNFVLRGEIPDVLVRVDPDRIMQVMANLLSNAAKFSPRGTNVEISAVAASVSVRISVTDHGGGIPQEFQSRIFGKFSQADASDSRKMGGSGLGLSIAKAIVEKHSGAIGFASTPRGTTFFFDLPLAFSGKLTEVDAAGNAPDPAIH